MSEAKNAVESNLFYRVSYENSTNCLFAVFHIKQLIDISTGCYYSDPPKILFTWDDLSQVISDPFLPFSLLPLLLLAFPVQWCGNSVLPLSLSLFHTKVHSSRCQSHCWFQAVWKEFPNGFGFKTDSPHADVIKEVKVKKKEPKVKADTLNLKIRTIIEDSLTDMGNPVSLKEFPLN